MSSGTLGLKQATRDTKPIVVRMKRARPAKPTFSTKNIAERIDEGKEAGAAATAAAPYDSLLARWLRDGHGDRDGFFEAREYLLKGPPYKGSSRFDAKDTIKELGAKWVPNALKDKGDANDKRCYGWWSAVDEATLAALIRLPLDEKSRRRWTALSTPEHAHFGILRLLKEFEVFTKMEEDDVKRKHDAARALKSALVANRARNDVPARLARALRFKLVTPAQCMACDFEDARRRKQARKTDAGNGTATRANSDNIVVFGSGVGMVRLPTTTEWAEICVVRTAEALANVDLSAVDDENEAEKKSYCETCTSEVTRQFCDCSCAGRTWRWCTSCQTAGTDTQPCECASADAATWRRRQNQIVVERKRAQELADEDVAQMGTCKSFDLPSPRAEACDDDPIPGAGDGVLNRWLDAP